MREYKQRIADSLLKRKMAGKGAVQIEGPKWCGKTTTAKQLAKSMLNLGDDSELRKAKQMMDISSRTLLKGETPRLIDEWQTIPGLWDTVRSEVDNRGEVGQFILTGSSVLPDAITTIHSGTGRYGHIHMRPMSLFESGESTGSISLENLFEGQEFEPVENSLELEDIAFLLCRGGWPQAVMVEAEVALDQAFEYLEDVTTKDIQRVDGIKRSEERAKRLLRSFARNVAHQVPYGTLRADILANDEQTLDEDTIADYIGALKKLYVIEDMEAWNPNLRSKAAVRTTDTRHFVDPSIGTAALGLGPQDLLNDLDTFGLLFENMAVRDLRVYADALLGKVYHYRDSDNLECDAVLHRRNGTYCLIEIKLGGLENIEKGAKTLKELAAKLDTGKMKSPSFLMVMTAVGEYAYRRPDGVFVVPIGCLRP